MSSVWKKPTFSLKQQETNWLNLTWATHDQFCHCDDPWLHFLIIINKQGNAPKPESDVNNIKCLLTGTKTDTTTADIEKDIGLEEGDLEKLFADDGGNPEEEPENSKR